MSRRINPPIYSDRRLRDCVPSLHSYARLLERTGRTNRSVLALLFTEMLFRDPLHRVLEYIAWIILGSLQAQRVLYLSVGTAQIQIRHWIAMGFIPDEKPRMSSLGVLLSLTKNYDACESWIHANSLEAASFPTVVGKYRGELRRYHLCVATAMRDTVSEWSRTIRETNTTIRGACADA